MYFFKNCLMLWKKKLAKWFLIEKITVLEKNRISFELFCKSHLAVFAMFLTVSQTPPTTLSCKLLACAGRATDIQRKSSMLSLCASMEREREKNCQSHFSLLVFFMCCTHVQCSKLRLFQYRPKTIGNILIGQMCLGPSSSNGGGGVTFTKGVFFGVNITQLIDEVKS